MTFPHLLSVSFVVINLEGRSWLSFIPFLTTFVFPNSVFLLSRGYDGFHLQIEKISMSAASENKSNLVPEHGCRQFMYRGRCDHSEEERRQTAHLDWLSPGWKGV